VHEDLQKRPESLDPDLCWWSFRLVKFLHERGQVLFVGLFLLGSALFLVRFLRGVAFGKELRFEPGDLAAAGGSAWLCLSIPVAMS